MHSALKKFIEPSNACRFPAILASLKIDERENIMTIPIISDMFRNII